MARRGVSMKRLLLALLGSALACAPVTEVTRLDPGRYPARPAAAVEVLEAFPSDRPYTSLARVEISDGGWEESRAEMVARVRTEAARVGADAVVVEPTTTRRLTGASVQGFGRYNERVVYGTAIRYLGETRR